MRMVITDHNFAGEDFERAAAEQLGADFQVYDAATEADAEAAVRDADIALVNFAPMTETVLGAMNPGAVVIRYGIGYDNVDLDAATRLRIRVCNVPDYGADTVADHTVTFVLTLLRKIQQFDGAVRRGEWPSATELAPIRSMAETTVGLLGTGRIGQAVARRLAPFGFAVIAYDPYAKPDDAADAAITLVELDELFRRSDVLSLHAPATPESTGIVNAQNLAAMPAGAVLVNTSRGALVDRTHSWTRWTRAPRRRRPRRLRTRAAARGPPLRSPRDVILTPHAAFYSESRCRVSSDSRPRRRGPRSPRRAAPLPDRLRPSTKHIMTKTVHNTSTAKWVPGESTFEARNPADDQVIATVPDSNGSEVDAAVAAARAAFAEWRHVNPTVRARHLHAIGDRVKGRERELAEAITAEMGKTIGEATGEVDKLATGDPLLRRGGHAGPRRGRSRTRATGSRAWSCASRSASSARSRRGTTRGADRLEARRRVARGMHHRRQAVGVRAWPAPCSPPASTRPASRPASSTWCPARAGRPRAGRPPGLDKIAFTGSNATGAADRSGPRSMTRSPGARRVLPDDGLAPRRPRPRRGRRRPPLVPQRRARSASRSTGSTSSGRCCASSSPASRSWSRRSPSATATRTRAPTSGHGHRAVLERVDRARPRRRERGATVATGGRRVDELARADFLTSRGRRRLHPQMLGS